MASKHNRCDLDEILITQDFNDLSCCGWRGEASKLTAKVHPSPAIYFPTGSQENQPCPQRKVLRFMVQGSREPYNSKLLATALALSIFSLTTAGQPVRRSGIDHLAIKRIMENTIISLPLPSPSTVFPSLPSLHFCSFLQN